jgi:uracil-DNA glycosylase
MSTLNINNYNYKTWGEKYPDHKVSLTQLKYHISWKELFEKEMDKKYFEELEEFLSERLEKSKGKTRLYPYPDLVFNAFKLTALDKVKVVILGQDPYHNSEIHDNKIIPQAMGLSFSVPVSIKIPSSLQNIFANQIKYDHIKLKPDNGNLESWAKQGCLMLNTCLTVRHGRPNCHSKHWTKFTDQVIKYISNNSSNIIFVLWGAPALNKLKLIDEKKHKVIISSHPSGLSANKKLRQYDAFMHKDHFGEINEYLKKHNKGEILW